MVMNKFRIITPSYNNEEWAEYNIASVLNQTYTNWEWIYINDASTDRTRELVDEMMPTDPRITLIHNEKNVGAMTNYFERGLEGVDDDTIVVHLDGDDWLIDIFVLEKLNEFYNRRDPLMTYGGMWVWQGGEDLVGANPQNSEFDDYTHEHQLYRKDVWRASHLRTYRASLLKAIHREDMIDSTTGEYYWEASDLSFQYPCLEMAGKERIGVVDFPTCVYNAHPKQTTRTAGRQHSSRHWEIETEIRNKRHYEPGGRGNRLPLINVLGYNMENSYIPKRFSFTYGREDGEFDATIITDFEILPYLRGERRVKRGKIIADIHESPLYDQTMRDTYQAVYDNYEKFDLILTHDERLLTRPNAKFRMCMWRTFLTTYHISNDGRVHPPDDWMIAIHPKSKNISCISSNKTGLEGHRRRLEFINGVLSKHGDSIDMFGAGFNPIPGKIDALRDYRFSIAIENACLVNGASEKISDCFLTGTIPIYYLPGCPNIGDYFNLDGIMTFSTQDELNDIVSKINEDPVGLYASKLTAVRENFETVQTYSLNMDDIFEKHIKGIL